MPILQALRVSLLTGSQLDPELAFFNARARVLAEQDPVPANLTVRRGRLVRVFSAPDVNICDRSSEHSGGDVRGGLTSQRLISSFFQTGGRE